MKVKTAKVLGILISALVLFASCGQMANDGETQVTISLPYVSGANSRAIDPGKKNDLINATVSYRVHMNDRVLEGTGGNFSALFAVGLKLDIYVECLNSNRDVIVRTATKSIIVSSGQNSVSFNLMAEGTEITPSAPPAPPQPVPGQVTYNGNGASSGTPSDAVTYNKDDTVTLKTDEPARTGYTFAGWTSNVELKYDVGGQEQTIAQGTAFVSNSSSASISGITKITSFKMPASGVVLTAQWNIKTYTIRYNSDGGSMTPGDATVKITDTFTLSTDYGTKADHRFSHWKDGTDDTDVSGWTVTQFIQRMEQNNQTEITLTAVWERMYSITYNWGSGVNVIILETKRYQA